MKMWSRIGSRATYGIAALELGEKYESQILTADLNIELDSVDIRAIINHHEQDLVYARKE